MATELENIAPIVIVTLLLAPQQLVHCEVLSEGMSPATTTSIYFRTDRKILLAKIEMY